VPSACYGVPEGDHSMVGLLYLVVLVLDIIAIFDCLKSNADTVKKLLWILVILFVPLVGMLLYFLLARGK
jgi:hypothetical protein